MKMDKKQIEKIMWEIIGKHLEVIQPEKIGLNYELSEMGVDSLVFSLILADMEDSFDFIIPGSDILKLKTLAAAIDYVEEHIS